VQQNRLILVNTVIVACDRDGTQGSATRLKDAAPSPALTLADPTPPEPWQKGPRESNTTIGSADVEGGKIGNAERVVAGMKAGFRACHNRGLASDPDAHGQVRIIVRVGTSGEVLDARLEPRGTLSDEIIDCLRRRVVAATFVAPEPSGSQATISFALTLSQREPGTDFR